MLYVYIIIIFIYSDVWSIFDSNSVISDIEIYELFGSVLVRFSFKAYDLVHIRDPNNKIKPKNIEWAYLVRILDGPPI